MSNYSYTITLPNGAFGHARKDEPKESIVVNHVNVRPVHRDTQDISKWRDAMRAAEGNFQNRQWLYDLYADILLDGFLKAQKEKRVARVTNLPLTFARDGKPVEDVAALAKKSCFEKLLREIVESRFWGHSLIELFWQPPGGTGKAQTLLVPRKHVKPRFGLVVKEPGEVSGTNYLAPAFADRLIEVGDKEDLGLFLQAAYYVILKRGNFGDWAEYAELFGMPFRWATYQNEASRAILEDALDKAGSAGYVVAPEGANLQFFNPAAGSSNADIFRFLRDAMNEEIAITLLGNTMTTTEAKHSGFAQSKTHADTQEEIHADDRMMVLRVLNEQLTPYLARLGYAVEGGEWAFVETDGMSLKERIEVDLKVATQVPVGQSYWYEKYGIPAPTDDDLPEGPEGGEEETDDEKGPGGTKAKSVKKKPGQKPD